MHHFTPAECNQPEDIFPCQLAPAWNRQIHVNLFSMTISPKNYVIYTTFHKQDDETNFADTKVLLSGVDCISTKVGPSTLKLISYEMTWFWPSMDGSQGLLFSSTSSKQGWITCKRTQWGMGATSWFPEICTTHLGPTFPMASLHRPPPPKFPT